MHDFVLDNLRVIIDDVVDFPLYTAAQENQLVSDASPDEVVD